MLTELLKNAFRATVEKHWQVYTPSKSRELPPVIVTISPPPRSRSIGRPSYLSVRIRDQGGGVAPANMTRVFSYAFTTAGRELLFEDDLTGERYARQHGGTTLEAGGSRTGGDNAFGEITGKGVQTGVGTLAGLGYGLPMSRLYAKCALTAYGREVADVGTQLLWRVFGFIFIGWMG